MPELGTQSVQVYLTTLESTKAWSLSTAAMAQWAPNEAARAGLANSFAGAVASMVTQTVVVPIDVVSQRLMVAGMVRQLHSHGLCLEFGGSQEICSTSYLQGIPEQLAAECGLLPCSGGLS